MKIRTSDSPTWRETAATLRMAWGDRPCKHKKAHAVMGRIEDRMNQAEQIRLSLHGFRHDGRIWRQVVVGYMCPVCGKEFSADEARVMGIQ